MQLMSPEELSAAWLAPGAQQLNSCSPGKCRAVMGMDGWNGAAKGRAWNLQQEFFIFLFYFPAAQVTLKETPFILYDGAIIHLVLLLVVVPLNTFQGLSF